VGITLASNVGIEGLEMDVGGCSLDVSGCDCEAMFKVPR